MLTIRFETTSQAFEGVNCGVEEAQRVLREVADRINGTSEVKMEGQITDSNGVYIGGWDWSPTGD